MQTSCFGWSLITQLWARSKGLEQYHFPWHVRHQRNSANNGIRIVLIEYSDFYMKSFNILCSLKNVLSVSTMKKWNLERVKFIKDFTIFLYFFMKGITMPFVGKFVFLRTLLVLPRMWLKCKSTLYCDYKEICNRMRCLSCHLLRRKLYPGYSYVLICLKIALFQWTVCILVIQILTSVLLWNRNLVWRIKMYFMKLHL